MDTKIFFIVTMIITFFMIMTPASAWWNDTHGMLAEKVCKDFNCSCISDITIWANIPDDQFKDMINHHDYDITKDCPESNLWDCPTKNDFKASYKMNEFLESAKLKDGCARWKDIAIASHYFFDTKVFWHNVQNENYFKCHKEFENQVNDKFFEKKSEWAVCTCGICVSDDEFSPWVLEFENKIDFIEKTGDFLLIENENKTKLTWFKKIIDWIFNLF